VTKKKYKRNAKKRINIERQENKTRESEKFVVSSSKREREEKKRIKNKRRKKKKKNAPDKEDSK
jgi:hypothetical protein